MSTLRGNQLYSKNSILSLRKFSNSIDFVMGMNSIDVEDCNFINYLSSKESQQFKIVKRYYDISLTENSDFLDTDFYFSNFNNSNPFKNNNIKKLIFETSKTTFDDSELLNLIKYKNKKKPGVQFFIKYDKEQEKGIVYLIDLYHMAIPTKKFGKNYVVKSRPKEDYIKRKKRVKHKVNLSDIL